MTNKDDDARILEYYSHIGDHVGFTENDVKAAFEEFADFACPESSKEEKYVQHLVDNHDIASLNHFFHRDMSWLFSNNRPWFNHVA